MNPHSEGKPQGPLPDAAMEERGIRSRPRLLGGLFQGDRKWVALIFLFALVLRLGFLVSSENYIDHQGIYFEAGAIAASLARGEGYSSPFLQPGRPSAGVKTGPTAWLAPGYPTLLSILFRIFGIQTSAAAAAALALNCLCGALICIPLFSVGRWVFGRETGFVAAGIQALDPGQMIMEINHIWDDSVFALLTATLLYLCYRIPSSLNRRTAVILGVFMGVACLFQAAMIPLCAFCVVWTYFRSALTRRQRLKYLAVSSLLFLLILGPWLVRNRVMVGTWGPRSNFGFEVAFGNNLEAWQALIQGGVYQDFGRWHPTVCKEEFERYLELGEHGYNQEKLQQALSFIRSNPGKFLQLCLVKFKQMWLGWSENPNFRPVIWYIQKLHFLVPIPFLILGLFVALKRGANGIPLGAFIVILPAIYYLVHTIDLARYRHPLIPVIIVTASGGLVFLVRRLWSLGKGAQSS